MMRGFARRHLPAPLQDLLRNLLDFLSPRRRGQSAQREKAAAVERAAAKRVSPDGRVLSGPFAGMWMPVEASWGGLSARLAGSYEEELTPQLAELVAATPSLVVDVGAAEGYYAVGLARALPSSVIYAFDIDRRARQLCRLTAQRNSASNVRVRGRMSPPRLERLLIPGALILSDCEGYELELLNPVVVPKLAQSTMLVELHEFTRRGLSEEILARFAETHDAVVIDARPRRLSDRPHLAHLTQAEVSAALDEGRPTEPHPMQWVVFRPRRS